MAKITMEIDKSGIKKIIQAYISYFRCEDMVKELYTGTEEKPCQESLLFDVYSGLTEIVKRIAEVIDFQYKSYSEEIKKQFPFIIDEQNKHSNYMDLVFYIIDNSIDIDVKTELIYEMICNKQ